MLDLLVGIDTESDNQWDARARANPTFQNIYALPRLHALFRRHGVRPTYLITYPVARDPKAVETLRSLGPENECEIGAHHHVWETPPCAPDDTRKHGYALSLPLDTFDAQVASLTETIASGFHRPPVSYRSGRFGFSAAHVSSLERYGYRVESSVTPLFYEGHKKGPDFVGAPLAPYFLSYDDACQPGASDLLELPVTAALNRRVPAAIARWYGRVPSPYTTKRILRLLRIAHVVWLRPSYSSLDEMKGLARRVAGAGVPVLNVIFHSSEALVGGSPYNRTPGELTAFLERLERFFAFATGELGAVPATFGEFRARHLAS